MKKLRNVMRKCMASLLVLCMAAAPCVTEIGSVFAEPDTDTDIEPVAYKVTLNDAQNGKVSFKDSEERTHSYKEGDKVALKVQADDGYTLEKLSVMNADKEIASKTDGTSFSFTMPAADLTVNASFKAAEKQKDAQRLRQRCHRLPYDTGTGALLFGQLLRNGRFYHF